MRIITLISFNLITILLSSCGLKTGVNSALSIPEAPLKIRGCLDSYATNYNSKSEEEDGSCVFSGCTIFDAELSSHFNQYQLQFPHSTLQDTCPAPITDIHNQSSRPHVGILWVIDNSFSMGEEINNLANNFNSFINEFVSSPLDFAMGITTTDSKHISQSFNTLTSNAARLNRELFIRNFKQLVKVGTSGSSTEKGYNAAKSFIEKYGPDFLQSKSYLSIIFLSDEADQSQKSPQEYLDFYSSHVSSSNKFRAHAILDLNNSGGDDDSNGERYLYSVNRTQGIKGDIHGNFAQILKDIGSNLIELKKNFPLTAKPYLPTLKVKVNDIFITNWTYSEVENTIAITPIPDFSAEIKISYTPAP